jgi:hypothetical protein
MKDERELMGPMARSLVESARAVDDPADADRAKIRARLSATLGVSALTAVTTKAAAAALAEGAAGGAGAAAAGEVGLGAAMSGSAAGLGAGAGGAAIGSAAGALGTSVGAAIGSAGAQVAAAGAGAGSAAVSGGFWALLGAKTFTSVVAAAAVGAAVTTAVVVTREDETPAAEQTAMQSAAQPQLAAARANASPAATRSSDAARTPGAVSAAPNDGARTSGLSTQRQVSRLEVGSPLAASKSPAGVEAVAASRADVPADARRATAIEPRERGAVVANASQIAATGEAASASSARSSLDNRRGGANANAIAAARPAFTANGPATSGANAETSATTARSPAPVTTQLAANPSSGGTVQQPTAATGAPARATGTDTANQPPLDDSLSTAARATNKVRPEATQLGSKPAPLSGEIQLLTSAQSALRDGQLPRALTLLNEHAASYPHGALRPEQLAARSVVLCRMGEINAGRSELQKLQAEAPSSPLIRWAREACGL